MSKIGPIDTISVNIFDQMDDWPRMIEAFGESKTTINRDGIMIIGAKGLSEPTGVLISIPDEENNMRLIKKANGDRVTYVKLLASEGYVQLLKNIGSPE